MYVCCLAAKPCPTLCEPKDCSLPGSSVHGISQARILEWVAISSSSKSSRPRNQTCISCISRWVLHHWTTWEAPQMYYDVLNFNLNPRTLKPLLETRFSDCTPEVVNESVGAGPWARGLWSLAQVTPNSAWLCKCPALFWAVGGLSRVTVSIAARAWSLIARFFFYWSIEQKNNWSRGNSEKAGETQRQTKTMDWVTALKNLLLLYFVCVCFNHRGHCCTRDIQRPKLWSKKKRSQSYIPQTNFACGVCCWEKNQARRIGCVLSCDPMDCSPPDSSIHGIFPGKDTGVGCHSSSRGSGQKMAIMYTAPPLYTGCLQNPWPHSLGGSWVSHRDQVRR